MTYSGQIQGWQVDGEHSSPMSAKVCYDIAQAINNETEMADGLKKFISQLKRKVMITGTIDWDDCPDDSFRVIWKHKQGCLNDLYQMISNVYSCHIPNTYFSDVYREKFDQALDHLSDDDTNVPAPLLGKDGKDDVGVRVLEQRSKWGGLLKLLEDYRVEGKTRIINASTVANATNALDVVIDELMQELAT